MIVYVYILRKTNLFTYEMEIMFRVVESTLLLDIQKHVKGSGLEAFFMILLLI